MSYTGWLLPEEDRARLLALFPPTYHDVLAHHVTLRMGTAELPIETHGEVIGIADDGLGCQVLVVSINGTHLRSDGGVFHITWSIDRETHHRKPVHANTVLQSGWTPVDPIPIDLVPMVFE